MGFNKSGEENHKAFAEGSDDAGQKHRKRYVPSSARGMFKFDAFFEKGLFKFDVSVSATLDDARQRHEKKHDASFVEDLDDKSTSRKRKSQKHALSNSTVFFLYNNLHIGQKMKLHITKPTNKAKILLRQVAESIPFSSDRFLEILQQFSIKPESLQAKIIKRTVEDCESSGMEGEDRFCPTSLESLLDLTISRIGNKVELLFNEIDKPTRMQDYTITGVNMAGENQVVCHKQKYTYAVYSCRSINATKVFRASLVGADGTTAKAVAVCHSDTSNWNPRHLALLMLNIKQGEGPICHFIRSDTIVWISNEVLKESSSNTNLSV
ncbi:Dehydration-responsive protein RD22 precursor, putative [Ricinus communis]|uniref:Dehydration-responsive protein RD22, putative n=1 Tax=Ricinus communis TaxID=3988 RepID=B9SB81_RICCO|nr:Dehydration-responsive protein RD22 precursor, putative [Ricinus communis]